MVKLKYYGPEYQQFDSSDEIICALERLFGKIEFDNDGEPFACETVTQWAEPTEKYIKEIEQIAWSVASKDTKKLWWGGTEIKRQN